MDLNIYTKFDVGDVVYDVNTKKEAFVTCVFIKAEERKHRDLEIIVDYMIDYIQPTVPQTKRTKEEYLRHSNAVAEWFPQLYIDLLLDMKEFDKLRYFVNVDQGGKVNE